jgi:hypothetical protein
MGKTMQLLHRDPSDEWPELEEVVSSESEDQEEYQDTDPDSSESEDQEEDQDTDPESDPDYDADLDSPGEIDDEPEPYQNGLGEDVEQVQLIELGPVIVGERRGRERDFVDDRPLKK